MIGIGSIVLHTCRAESSGLYVRFNNNFSRSSHLPFPLAPFHLPSATCFQCTVPITRFFSHSSRSIRSSDAFAFDRRLPAVQSASNMPPMCASDGCKRQSMKDARYCTAHRCNTLTQSDSRCCRQVGKGCSKYCRAHNKPGVHFPSCAFSYGCHKQSIRMLGTAPSTAAMP